MENDPMNAPASGRIDASGSANGGHKGNSASSPLPRMGRIVGVKTAVVIAVVLIIGALTYYYKGMFVAATVNGYPITRVSVVRELEKNGGKRTLDALVTERLMEDEARKKGVSVSDEEVNEEVKKIEAQLSGQGETLDSALSAQGLTREDFVKQISIQKKVEKILADSVQVSDAEVDAHIADSNIQLPQGQEAELKNQIKEQMKQQKFSQEARQWLDGLRTQAKIRYYVNY